MKNKFIILLFTLFISALGFSQTEGTVTIDSSPEIKKLIAKKIKFNNEHHLIDGYRIQLFYGSERGVNNTNAKFKELFPNTSTYIKFDSPDWKIRVGNYKTKLEATKALQRFKLEFGSAFVMPYRISG